MAGSSAEVGQLLTTAEKHCNGWVEEALQLSQPISSILSLLPQPLLVREVAEGGCW